jgi:hypothetical protein
MRLRRIAGPAAALAILLLLGWWIGRGSAPVTDGSTTLVQKAPRPGSLRESPGLSSPSVAKVAVLRSPGTSPGLADAVVLDVAGAAISGTVVDATGGFVPGATVAVLERRERSATVAQTDASGAFSLSARPGRVELIARADGYSQATQTVQAPAEGVTFVLAPGATIPGTVVDASSGSALAGVRVVAASESGLAAPGSANSDAAGEFQLSGLEGGVYLVSVRDEAFWAAPERVSVAVGQSSAPIVLRASRASQLRLTALHEGGAPCRDATVLLSGDGAELHEFAADGSFKFEGLAPGDYDIDVQCAGALVQTERLQLGAGAQEHEVIVSVGITLSGRVERASGERLGGAEVNVSPIGAPERSAASCTTDERGEFRCSGLSEGEHVARVTVGGEPASEAVSVTLGPDDAPPIILKTFGLGTIRVSLRDEGADRPFEIFATSERGIPLAATSDGSDVLFENLPLGRYRISVDSEPEDSDQSSEVTLARDGQIERVTLSLPATHSIAGRVLDEHGTPVVDAAVRVSTAALGPSGPSTAHRQLAVTDDEGQFIIAGLSRGRYDVRVESAIGDGAAHGISAGVGSVHITVVRHARLSGSVRERSGEMPATFLIVYEREDGSSHQVPGQAGRWDLGSIQPGKYRVTASSLKARATEEVLLRAGEARELVLQLSEP